jgi:signal transduction histidine kinase/ActR/RegA family two-component response regulator
MIGAERPVLILAPTGRDATLSCSILREEGFPAEVCGTMEDLCARASDTAGALLIAEEALPPRAVTLLVDTLDAQPPWSDIPLIVLAGSEFTASSVRPLNVLGALRNVMILERPVRRLILSRSVAIALRARRRQFELRDHLEQRSALLDRERAARAEAELANRMKDQFLMTVSHELRTPLTAIYGWARMLLTGEIRPDQTPRALQAIERNAQAQTQLVNDLLDVSRAISGKLRLNVRPVDLADVMAAAVASIEPAANAKGIRIETRVEADVGPISADRDRLQQVLWNLLSNAVKFTSAEGRITIDVRRQGSSVEISVADTGTGIDPEFLPYVFDRFRQAEGGTTRQHGGLGLGLAIVRHLVELHGGTVTAESGGPGCGALFRIVLPVADTREHQADIQDPSESQELARPPATHLDGIRVLIVEDDPHAQELFAAMVGNAAGEFKVAQSAHEAVAVLEEWWPDVLLSDIEMPGTDGYSLMRHVRALAASHAKPLAAIAITAHSRPDDRLRALEAGFQWHLPKPTDPAELVAAIAALTGRLTRAR